MSFTNIPLLKPTVKLKSVNPRYAIYGHIVSSIGGFFAIVSSLMNLLDHPVGALIGLVSGIFILMIEFDQFIIDLLKEPVNRGVTWIILGSVSFGLDLLVIILIFVGGALYFAYHYQ